MSNQVQEEWKAFCSTTDTHEVVWNIVYNLEHMFSLMKTQDLGHIGLPSQIYKNWVLKGKIQD